MFFHKSIKEKFELHLKKLKNFQLLENNWFWHKDKIIELNKLLIKIHDESIALNENNPFINELRKNINEILNLKNPDLVLQKELAEKINKILDNLKDTIDYKPNYNLDLYIEKYINKIDSFLQIYKDHPEIIETKIEVFNGKFDKNLIMWLGKTMSNIELPLIKEIKKDLVILQKFSLKKITKKNLNIILNI